MNDPSSFRPTGFNLGGWISQSPLTDGHASTFIRPDDLKDIASWGFTSVRLPVDAPWLFDQEGAGHIRPDRFQALLNYMSWAWKAGLHVVLDLHHCAWHHFNKKELTGLWTDPSALSSFCAQWEELASSLWGVEEPLWVEILNEPTAQDPADWNKAAKEILRAARKGDPKRVLVVESTRWGSVETLDALANEVAGDKVVLSFHFYEPIFFTHQAAPWWKDGLFYKETVEYPGPLPRWKEALAQEGIPPVGKFLLEARGPVVWNRDSLRELMEPAFRLTRKGVPLYCGEFGAYERAPQPSRLAWTRDVVSILDEMGAGWAYWNYKWLDFGVLPKPVGGGKQEVDGKMLGVLQGK